MKHELTKEEIERLPDTIFFYVGCGTAGYPPCEPFYTWLSSMLQPIFHDKEWLAKQDITVVEESSANCLPVFRVSASKEWFLKNCRCLLENTEYRVYLDEPDFWMGYTEPRGYQVLNDQTRGKLFSYSEIREFIG